MPSEKDGYAHGTINATLTRLSVIRRAIRQEIITCRNPCDGVKRLPTKPRQDCYTLDEVHRLFSARCSADDPDGALHRDTPGSCSGCGGRTSTFKPNASTCAALRWANQDRPNP